MLQDIGAFLKRFDVQIELAGAVAALALEYFGRGLPAWAYVVLIGLRFSAAIYSMLKARRVFI